MADLVIIINDGSAFYVMNVLCLRTASSNENGDLKLVLDTISYVVSRASGNHIIELKQPRRLRQMKRHSKINICALVTTLRLLLFARILYC